MTSRHQAIRLACGSSPTATCQIPCHRQAGGQGGVDHRRSAIATSDEQTVASFGSFTMLGRAGQPEETAPAYVFLVADGSFVTGALLEVSGGFKSMD
jgi:NAD(P)-dependent dehydrogenase (short-subunit alcohol dehydrogenase family)